MTKHFKLETKSAPDPIEAVQAALAEIQTKAAGAAKVGEQLDEIGGMVRQIGARVDQMEIRNARPGVRNNNGAPYASGEEKAHLDLFVKMLRNPRNAQARAELQEIEAKSATGATGAAGGFVIPSVLQGPLLRRATNGNPWRGLVRQVEVATRDIGFPLSNSNSSTGWVGEGDTRPGTDEATLMQARPTFGTLYALVESTEELAMDAAFDIGAWFAAEAADRMAEAEATAIVTGNGTNRPTGLLNVAPQAGADGARTANAFRYLPTGNASTLGTTPADLLVNLVYDLKAGYRARGTFVMNSQVAGEVRKLKDTTGRFLWTDGLAAGQPATLLGYPVVIAEDMPGIAAGTHPIAFGDFDRAYVLADNGGLRVTVDDNISTPGRIRWYIRRRIGGIPYDNQAVRFLRVSVS